MKKIIILWMMFCLLALLTGCYHSESEGEAQLHIVTTFYPMYLATSNIVENVEGVKLTNMTNTEVGCLHDYQLTTRDMNLLEHADVLVVNGGGMENFIEKAMSHYPKLYLINASEGILESHEEEKHDVQEKGEHHHEDNAHIWVSISMYQEQVKNIANALAKADTAHATMYLKNAEQYLQKLDALRQEMHTALDTLPHRNIVTFHEAFAYFAEEFDLHVVAVIEREPGTNPSAGELAQIIETVKKTDATAIFVEPQYETSTAKVIAKETNKPVYVLDPVVTGALEKDAYEKLMRQNLTVLEEALR